MGSVRAKGTLKKWFEEKGFGFIAPDKGSNDIFIHISSFGRDISRRPEVGDTIFYYITSDKKGKTKAVDALIEGAVPAKPTRMRKPQQAYKRRKKRNWKFLILCSVILVAGGSTLYKRFQTTGKVLPSKSQISNFIGSTDSGRQSAKYTCAGKTHCSQMKSCEEAKFYIRNCPDTKMDGDRDGIPCERQLCN